jgi:hypothetical protein
MFASTATEWFGFQSAFRTRTMLYRNTFALKKPKQLLSTNLCLKIAI